MYIFADTSPGAPILNDPIVKAIQASIVSITLSNGALGARLAKLYLMPDAELLVALLADGENLSFNRERVKKLTTSQLKTELEAWL